MPNLLSTINSDEVISELKKRGIYQAKHSNFLKELWETWKILSSTGYENRR